MILWGGIEDFHASDGEKGVLNYFLKKCLESTKTNIWMNLITLQNYILQEYIYLFFIESFSKLTEISTFEQAT